MIGNSSLIKSKLFYFGIKGFGKGIGFLVLEVI